jgi:WD40 repeat protein
MSHPATIEGFTKSLAILVAIDSYLEVPVLHTPVADAEKLAQVLREDHGFETELLRNEEATFDKLTEVLAGLVKQVGANDRVLFYFAGHGTALPSDDGPRGYILPQDAERDSDRRYLPMEELSRALSALPCRHMLVILDCCFAGALRWTSTRDLVFAPANLHRERYEWFIRDAAWQAIASAAHDQKALDVAAGQPLGARNQVAEHSPFANALIDGLAGAADRRRADGTGDGVITVTELYLHLEEQLMPPPGSGRPRQTPILWPLAKHDKGQFVFLVPGQEPNLPPAPPLDFTANPWVGLEPYDSTQSALFFGRRQVSEVFVQRLLRDPLVVVTGPSGIGKSSLVRAGLLPRLKGLPIVPIMVRPGATPFATLAAALQAVERPGMNAPGETVLRTDPLALKTWIMAQDGDRQFLLVIDQAEELITQNRDLKVLGDFLTLIENALDLPEDLRTRARRFEEADARLAIEAMGYGKIAVLIRDDNGLWRATAEKDGKQVEAGFDLDQMPLRVVLTVRSEFEPQFAQLLLKGRRAATRFLIPRMTQDELRRVIEGPAGVKVIRFESSALIDQLVNEVVDMPGALPVLSFALSEMYANYIRRGGDDRTLSFEDFDALSGGVTGSLRVRANEIVDAVGEPTTRRVLERFVSVEAGAFARRRVPRWELSAADAVEQARVDEIISRFTEARLMVADRVGDEPFLELAHDALILGWDRLLGWIREDATRIATLRLLTPNAEEWSSDPRKKSGLLWADPERIVSIRELVNAPSPGLNRQEADFAAASVQRARRNSIWRSATIVTLLALALVTTTAAIYANFQSGVARENAARATAERNSALINQSHLLEKEARSRMERGDNVTAMLLALEALRDKTSNDPVQRNRPYVGTVEQVLLSARYDSREMASHELSGNVHVVSPDGKTIVSGTPQGDIELLPIDAPSPTNLPRHHRNGIIAIAFSADSKYFAAADRGRTSFVSVWDRSGVFRAGISTPELSEPRSIAVSSDGNMVVLGLDYTAEIVWPGDTAREPKVLGGTQFDGVDRIVFSPDGAVFVTVSNLDRSPHLWSRAGDLISKLPHPADRINAVVFSHNSSRIATATQDGFIFLWNAADGHQIRAYQSHGQPVCCLAFLPDDQRIVAGSKNGDVFEVSDASASTVTDPVYRHDMAVTSLSVIDGGRNLLSTSRSGDARIWDLAKREAANHFQCANGIALAAAQVGDQDEIVLVCSEDEQPGKGILQRFRRKRPVDSMQYAVSRMQINSVQFDLKGKRVLFASEDGNAGVIDVLSHGEPTLLKGHLRPVSTARFSSDARLIVTASSDGGARVWTTEDPSAKPKTFGNVREFRPDVMLYDAVVLPDGSSVIAAMSDGTIRVWDVSSGEEVSRITRDEIGDFFSSSMAIRHLALNKAGNILAVSIVRTFSYPETEIRLYKVVDKKSLVKIGIGDAIRGGSLALKFANEDRSLLAMSQQEVVVFSVGPDGSLSRDHFLALPTVAGDAALSPNGKRLVVSQCSELGNPEKCNYMLVFDAEKTLELARLVGHETYVSSIDIAPDGKTVVSGAADGSVRIWPLFLDTQDLIDETKKTIPRCLTMQQRSNFGLEQKNPDWCRVKG